MGYAGKLCSFLQMLTLTAAVVLVSYGLFLAGRDESSEDS